MQKNKKPKSKEEDGRSMKKDIAAWEKKVATVQKGSYWMWKTDLQITTDMYTTVYLTAVKDAKICWRLDNFLGAGMTTGMSFWDYEAASGDSNVKSKNWIFVPNVPLVHNIFRKFMGHVDQADVKAHVMGLTKLMSRDWHDKQSYKSKKRILRTATERGLRCPMRDRLGVSLRLALRRVLKRMIVLQ